MANGMIESRPRWRRWILLSFLLLAAGVVCWVYRKPVLGWFYYRLQGFIEWVRDLGAVGPVVFILGYALMTVALIPAALLTMGAGTVFGLLPGLCYSLLGASLGAAAAFLTARYCTRSLIEERVRSSRRFRAIDRAVAKEGLKICMLLRLSPIFPFVFLNYILGLTKVRFLHYNIASLAMLPGTLLYVYYGSLAKDVAELAAQDVEEESWGAFTVRLVGLVATIVITVIVTRVARKALRAELPETENAEAAEPQRA